MLQARTLIFAIALASAMVLQASAAERVSGNRQAENSFPAIKSSPIIPAPSDPAQWPEWRNQLAWWREDMRKRVDYDDSLYRRSDFAWVSSCYSCCFVMMCDQTFYDPKEGRYTIESFLRGGDKAFGGYDAVVLWHAYPRIGFDDRNQFDFYRDMPGGLAGLREVSRALHARGIRVFVDYNPWDTGTRREGKSDTDALAEIVKVIEADGIFLDTMARGAEEFRKKLDAARPGVALETEGALAVERVYDHHLSWAQGFQDSVAPGVLRNKWFERRHMMHQIKRWDRDHTGELHAAWMNGSGTLVWENVFGSWVGWSARDRSILRAMLPVQRRHARLFSSEGWTPLVKTETDDVYASLWESDGIRLWTLVNRSEKPVSGTLLAVRHADGTRYGNLIAGQEIESKKDGTVLLGATLRPRGIGAFIAGSEEALGKDFSDFLARQAALDARADFDTKSPALEEKLNPIARTREYRKNDIPEGMVAISATTLEMEETFLNRECGFYRLPEGVDFKLPLSRHHQLNGFKRKVKIKSYAIDLTPVTNAQFEAFLNATKYVPKHPENFLKHWVNGVPPAGKDHHPVVYVDLDDARAYARWAGKRLPAEEEWQYAAQGPDKRVYPWGNEMKAGVCNTGQRGDTTSVTAFPNGRSPFGCYDMCGNVWEWTESERSDGRTRFCILRGGSFFKAQGSQWYADGGPQPCSFGAKFLLMWPGLDRCSTIGFRCAVDLAE
jgi:formylglycine-generating enzyme required for sulfatase activity